VTLLEGSPSDIVKQMKTFLLLPLGLGTVLGSLGACSNEPSSTLLTIPSPTPQPELERQSPAPLPETPPQFPTPHPGTAPQPVILGGQTGSGSAPARMTCEAPDGGASRGVLVEANPELRSSCAALVERAYRRLMPDLEPVSSACVPAASMDPSLSAGAPICQCSFDSEDPRSDTRERVSVTYSIGLERSRTLLGKPAGGCEAAGPYQWQGSASGNESCAFASEDFAGCSLDAAATSCEATCATLRARQAELAANVTSRYAALGDECHSIHDLGDCYGACIGAVQVAERCYRGVIGRYTDVFDNLEQVDCAAPLADTLEPRQTDRVLYVPFCTDHSDVDAAIPTTTFDAGLDGGESP
jgi:hypothetical protein